MISSGSINKIKPIIIIILILPSFIWIWLYVNGSLGVNPIDILMDNLGKLALQLLLVVLTISSLSQIKFLRSLQNLRRIIGIFAFYYASLHLSCYLFLDHFFNFSFIFKDIIKRPFITFGFLGFILFLPLVFTSTNNMVKKLTFNVWKKIHYLIYLIIIFGILHFYLLTKANKIEPLIYLGIVIFLFIIRIYKRFNRLKVQL